MSNAPLRSTVADVDLDAIAANLEVLRYRAQAAVIAVVKADAYGHGVEAVAETLVEAGAVMLAVVTVEEGLALRRSGITRPILVLLGPSEPGEADAAVAAGLTLAVWDMARAREVDAAAGAQAARASVHFKVDTGLTRLGAPVEDAADRYRAIRELPHVAVDGIFTHLATSDEPDTTYDAEQLARFAAVLAHIGEPPRFVHAAASAGVAAFGPLAGCTAIRPGLALYGVHPAPHLERALPGLRPALRWRSRILRLARVRAGTGVSYGLEYRLPRDGSIATVPVGYGDGLPRGARARGAVLVGGKRVGFAGRICMDLVMLDVSELRGVLEGDEVVLIGDQGGATLGANDLAAASGTINYEILTGIRRRVPRRYFRGDRIVATRTLAEGYRRQ